MPGTRQTLALGKSGLCRVPPHSAKVPLRKRWPARDGGHLPSDFAECLTASTRQFFFLFLKTYFAECQPQTLGKFFFKKTYFAECQPMALGKFFFNFLKLILPSAGPGGTRQSFLFIFENQLCRVLLGPALGKAHFAECPPWHSTIFF